MDSFFSKYRHLSSVHTCFKHVQDNIFYALDDNTLNALLWKTEERLKSDFLEKYIFEKNFLCSQCSDPVIMEEAFDLTLCSNSSIVCIQDMTNASSQSNLSIQHNFSLNMEVDNADFSNENEVGSTANDDQNKKESFEFKKNGLYHILLNEPSKMGKLVLDKYKNKGILDKTRLKEIVVLHYMYKDPINYSCVFLAYFSSLSHFIYASSSLSLNTFSMLVLSQHRVKSSALQEIAAQILELFPSETDADLYYIPYKEAKHFGAKNAKGSLYNTYNELREEFGLAGYINLQNHVDPENKEKEIIDNPNAFTYIDILCDKDYKSQNSTEVGLEWNKIFVDRVEKLTKTCKVKGGELEFVKSYFDYKKHYTCLNSNVVTSLLVPDYDKIIESLITNQSVLPTSNSSKSHFFKQKWPNIAKKIIKYCRSSRNSELQEFKKQNKEFFNKVSDEQELTIAFYMLPKCLSVSKNILVDGTSIPVDKEGQPRFKFKTSSSYWLRGQLPPNGAENTNSNINKSPTKQPKDLENQIPGSVSDNEVDDEGIDPFKRSSKLNRSIQDDSPTSSLKRVEAYADLSKEGGPVITKTEETPENSTSVAQQQEQEQHQPSPKLPDDPQIPNNQNIALINQRDPAVIIMAEQVKVKDAIATLTLKITF
uniref:Uncharacterized protein n=1 Tax=Trichogramma kaykai TaxID=54128 RepID=A0ABD2X0H3_9HYME